MGKSQATLQEPVKVLKLPNLVKEKLKLQLKQKLSLKEQNLKQNLVKEKLKLDQKKLRQERKVKQNPKKQKQKPKPKQKPTKKREIQKVLQLNLQVAVNHQHQKLPNLLL